MLSCKIYEIFKDNFEEHLSTTASNFYLKRDFNTGVFLWILGIIQERIFRRWTAGSQKAMRVSFFNKVASLTALWPLTVLEGETRTTISLWNLWNF